jgi:hypothetical protein
MFSLTKLWDENGFEILLGLCLAIILIYGFYRIITNQKGSWSNSYSTYTAKDIDNLSFGNKNRNYVNTNRNVPKESKGEIECKRVLEKIFSRPFNKIRPSFLNNKITGGSYNLEIDCYNDELKLGVEYSGRQHYDYIPYFHKNKEAFYNQKYRDELKRHMCKDNGVILIEVPYTVKIEDIENFLRKELSKTYF